MMIDQGYVTDPALFYVPMPGKVKPEPGQKLKPENVSWDLTGGVTSNDPNTLPLVFLTGWRVTYAPGAAAVPLLKPFPDYGNEHHWLFFWRNESQYWGPPALAVSYKGNNAKSVQLQDGSIPNFVPVDFDAKGKTYRQLTPDGVMR